MRDTYCVDELADPRRSIQPILKGGPSPYQIAWDTGAGEELGVGRFFCERVHSKKDWRLFAGAQSFYTFPVRDGDAESQLAINGHTGAERRPPALPQSGASTADSRQAAVLPMVRAPPCFISRDISSKRRFEDGGDQPPCWR